MKDLVLEAFESSQNEGIDTKLDLKENCNGCLEYSSMAYERVAASAKYVMERTQYRPKIAIICGSGLGKNSSLILAYLYLDVNPTTALSNIPPSPLIHS